MTEKPWISVSFSVSCNFCSALFLLVVLSNYSVLDFVVSYCNISYFVLLLSIGNQFISNVDRECGYMDGKRCREEVEVEREENIHFSL